jgi:hypothetical protein
MPPEHAGAAAVYLALRLADEFHGQVVNGYEVLERASLLRAKVDLPSVGGLPADPTAGLAEIAELAGQLRQILAETDAEFNRLPIFVRPMARNGFKGQAGQSLADWQRRLAALEAGEKLATGDMLERLDKLAGYYRGVPKETARFTRDSEMVRQVTEVCRLRIGVIEQLKARLKQTPRIDLYVTDRVGSYSS